MGRRSTVLVESVRIAAVALCIQMALAYAPDALAQQPVRQPAPPAPGRGRGPVPVDPRVQMREYSFTDTNEKIPIGTPAIFRFFGSHAKPAPR